MKLTSIPTFGLKDIPEDFDIELDADFVQFLDRVNRPWKYDPDGTFHPKRRHNPHESAVFWEAGWYSDKRPRMRKLRTAGYFRRNHFYEKLWGYHRYHDAHVARYGYIIWYDIASTGMIATDVLVEKGTSFLQTLEPILDEFLAIVQKIEQRDEQDFKYRKNRFKEIKLFPTKVLNALENGFNG